MNKMWTWVRGTQVGSQGPQVAISTLALTYWDCPELLPDVWNQTDKKSSAHWQSVVLGSASVQPENERERESEEVAPGAPESSQQCENQHGETFRDVPLAVTYLLYCLPGSHGNFGAF